jgi:hypothetical protein
MNIVNSEADMMRIQAARQSFIGKSLTHAQFEESWALSGVMEREIRRSGSFKDKLGDYSHAFARSEKFDAMKAETIVRDIFKSRYQQTMNQMREGFKKREASLNGEQKINILSHAREIGTQIIEGTKVPFYQAFDSQAVALSGNLNITESGAKNLMKQAFKESDGQELYEWGKELEKQYYVPQLEAERTLRKAEKAQSRSRTQKLTM